MKVNMPVTDHEILMAEGQTLVSKTDLKGAITYVNPAFIQISGFDERELIGKNHNMVRHPDMPSAAFQDLWDTIKQGRPWDGVIKNRCKNGDFYWVNAQVIPVKENGKIVEYMSVRKKPSANQIAEAESLYKKIKDGEGSLAPKGIGAIKAAYSRISFMFQAKLLSALIMLLLIFTFYVSFVTTMNPVSEVTKASGLQNSLVIQAHEILIHFKIQVQEWKNILLRGNDSKQYTKYLGKFGNEELYVRAELRKLKQSLDKMNIDSEEIQRIIEVHKVLGDKYRHALTGYDKNNPLSYSIVDKLVKGVDRPATKSLDELGDWLFKATNILTQNRIKEIDKQVANQKMVLAFVLVSTFLVIVAFLGILLKGLLGPARKVVANINEISQGNFNIMIDFSGDNEISQLNQTLRIMQVQLNFDLDSSREREMEASRTAQALEACSTNVLFADTNLDITYLNPAIKKMFSDSESAMKKDIPGFKADALIGANLETFHKGEHEHLNKVKALKESFSYRLNKGGRTFDKDVTPVFNEQGEKIGTVVEWHDRTEDLERIEKEHVIADTNARMKQALDTVSANVMVADADRNIIYMNQAVTDTLTHAESDIRTELSNFSVQNLIGNSIDIFHKNPAHQKQMLENLTSEIIANIIVGGRHMKLVVNPITNDQKERIGTVVEWTDQTNEVAIELEIDTLVEASANGDLSKRINPEGKTGFFAKLAKGLNQTVESTDSFVKDMGIVLSAMSEGNLTKTIEKDYKGSFGELKIDVNKTISQITDVISNIRESSGLVHSAANEIYQGNDDLSRRTEAQASSLEETASSMEEITSTVKESSANASEANTMTIGAKQKASAGGEVVKEAIKAMSDILDSSNKINDIIGVIDEIAFQTNLLALNAAVEAARAGEQGRGFAVVAGEVRTLSQRSAGAAKEIKDLIRDSVNKVESGSKLVNESGDTLSEIVSAIDDVATRVDGIATAAAEQNAGIGQINQAISQMDDMTQQNAALVEEASAASRALSEQAGVLNKLVGFFTVG